MSKRREELAERESFLDVICRTSAAAVADWLRASDRTADHIVALLRANGSLPSEGGESPEEYDAVSEAALDRFEQMLSQFLEIAFHFAIEDDRDYLRGLRAFYLQRRESYSIEELAAVWRTSCEEVRDVFHDEIDRWADAHPDAPDAPRIRWREAVDANDAFAIARAIDVERALGSDFARVRAPGWRTVPVLLHLPRFITDAISSEAGGSPNRTLAARVEQFILDAFMAERIRCSTANLRSTRKTFGS